MEGDGDLGPLVAMNPESAVYLARMLYHNAVQAKGTDFTIHAGDQTVHCHKVVLQAVSDFFRPICSTGAMQYRFDNNDSIIMDAEGLLASVVRFFYLGTVDLNDENVQPTLGAALVLDCHKLTEVCQTYLLRNLTIEKCSTYKDIAEVFEPELRNLKNKCIQMANGELEESQFISTCVVDQNLNP